MSVVIPEGLSVNEVAGLCRVHSSSVWRWILKGVRGRKLKTLRIGDRRVITQEALDEFIRPAAPQPVADSAAVATRTRRLVQRRKAAAVLDSAGI